MDCHSLVHTSSQEVMLCSIDNQIELLSFWISPVNKKMIHEHESKFFIREIIKP